MIKGIVFVLAASMAILAMPDSARAFETRGQMAEARFEVQATISSRQARAAAERAHPNARAVDVRFVDGRRPFYIVRMTQGNRRFDVRVDAQTGRIL